MQRGRLFTQFGQHEQRGFVNTELLERELAQWHGRCWICHQRGQDEWHALVDCPHPEGQAAQQWADRIQRTIRFDNYSGCFFCGVPQAICEQWRSNGQGRWVKDAGHPCQYPKGSVISMVAAILYGGDATEVQAAWRQWLGEHQVDGQDNQQVIAFLGRRVVLGGMEQNYLAVAFGWLRQLYSPRS